MAIYRKLSKLQRKVKKEEIRIFIIVQTPLLMMDLQSNKKMLSKLLFQILNRFQDHLRISINL